MKLNFSGLVKENLDAGIDLVVDEKKRETHIKSSKKYTI